MRLDVSNGNFGAGFPLQSPNNFTPVLLSTLSLRLCGVPAGKIAGVIEVAEEKRVSPASVRAFVSHAAPAFEY
jgi:hypothetical protein